jgi:hypothetical protein
MIWEVTNNTVQYASSNHQTLAVHGMGSGFCRGDPPGINEGSSVCIDGHGLFH